MKIPCVCVAIALVMSSLAWGQSPDPGPYYFMSDALGTTAQYAWSKPTTYGGITIIENFNLLAHVLGDIPKAPAGARLVPAEDFRVENRLLKLQPFAVITGKDVKKRGLDIGIAAPRLARFLADPLAGAKFDLTLPFKDSRVALSDNSALLRPATDEGCWHTALDLDVSGGSTTPFDVVAPADGVVEGNVGSVTLAIRHVAPNKKEFLTLYSHIVPASKAHLKKGVNVKRGEVIGRIDEGGKYCHLHFSVAVRGPAKNVAGAQIPELWYVIDPLGVYDYRRNKENRSTYNYLPNNTLAPKVRGVHMAYVFRTNPLLASMPPAQP